MSDNDDFWGNTPDWTRPTAQPGADVNVGGDRPGRPGRTRAARSGSMLKKLWGSTLDAGTHATREHRIVDATAEDATNEIDLDGDDAFSIDITPRIDRHAPGRPPLAPRTPTSDDRLEIDRGTRDAVARNEFAEFEFAEIDVPHDDVADGYPGAEHGHADDDDWHGDDRPRVAAGGVDPLLARFGAVVIVLTLLVPLLVGLRSNDGADELIASAGAAQETAAVDAPTTTSGPAAATTTSPATSTSQATSSVDAPLDPADLPPAIPVNDTEPAASDDDSGSSADADAAADVAARGERGSAALSTSDDDGIADAADADSQADRQQACAIDYTVREGDFWIRLADASGVDLADLLDVNDATVDTPLYPGAEICLPAGASTPAPPATAAPTSAAPTSDAPTTAAPTTDAPSTSTATTTTTTTTATAPAPPATVAPTPPAGPDEIVAIIREVWPDDLEDRALEIAYRESRYVPTAKNFCCYGLFQIYWTVHQSWLADMGITDDQQLYDPETNARAAYALYQRSGGWGPWGF